MFEINLPLIYTLCSVLLLIALDTLLGVSLALKKGDFKINELPRFLRTQVLPYYIGLMSLTGFAMVDNEILQLGTVPFAYTALATYAAKVLWNDIRVKFMNLLGVEIKEK